MTRREDTESEDRMTTTTPRRRRTEAERAQERYDLAVRQVDQLEARRGKLTREIEGIEKKLDEAHAIRVSYAGFPGVVAEHPDDRDDADPAQTSIDDVLDEEPPEGGEPA